MIKSSSTKSDKVVVGHKITGDCNVYLYLTPEPFVIDTGRPDEREVIRREIEKFIRLSKIKKVLLTHLHYDHCGNVNLFPNAEIFADEEEIRDYHKRPEVFFFGDVPPEVKQALTRMKPLPQEINGLLIRKVPGHTHGSVFLVDENNKYLFSGDTVFFNGIGRTDFPNSQPELMGESIEVLVRELREKNLILMPGHDY